MEIVQLIYTPNDVVKYSCYHTWFEFVDGIMRNSGSIDIANL
jgi:hypothetical protein